MRCKRFRTRDFAAYEGLIFAPVSLTAVGKNGRM